MKIKVKYIFGLFRNIYLIIRHRGAIKLNIFRVYIHPSTRVEVASGGGIVFESGRRIYIDRGGLIRASGGNISFGAGLFINQGGMVVAHQSISIGREVMFGPGVCIFDSDHGTELGRGGFSSQGYNKASVIIANNVWLGAHAVVTKGSVVGENVVVAANSVARGLLIAGSVYAGVPAVRVKVLS
jgi:acetyltransferase-like isoleucine patch superfamily enzyme